MIDSKIILPGISKALKQGKIPALAYDRVSTAEQVNTGLSLTHQNTGAQEYADRNNLHIVYTFSCVHGGTILEP